jgi:hypothetical protein
MTSQIDVRRLRRTLFLSRWSYRLATNETFLSNPVSKISPVLSSEPKPLSPATFSHMLASNTIHHAPPPICRLIDGATMSRSRSLIRPRQFSGMALPPIPEAEPSRWDAEEAAYVALPSDNCGRDHVIPSWQRQDDHEDALQHKEYTIALKIPSFALGAAVGRIVQLSSLAVNSCVRQRLNTCGVAALGLLWCLVACAATFAAARCCRSMIASPLLSSHTSLLPKPLDFSRKAWEHESVPLPSADADETDPLERWFIAGALAGILLTAALVAS